MSEIFTGTQIERARKEKGLTQKQLAEKLYVSNKAVSKWERGLNYPDIALLKPLSEILDISIAHLICDEKNSTESVVEKTIEISQSEKNKIKGELKFRSISVIVICFILISLQLYNHDLISNLNIDDIQVRGLDAHNLTTFPIFNRLYDIIRWSMLLPGIVMGHSIYTLINLKKI